MAEVVFRLPDLGEGLEEAEVCEWHVTEGDVVDLNQPLLDVNTEKALVEIPSPFAGVIINLHVKPGDFVKVGAPLATFALAEEAPQEHPVLVGYGPQVNDREANPPHPRLTPPAGDRRASVRASPRVRRIASEAGVDLAGLEGSGSGGRITREDVALESKRRQAVTAEAEGEERLPVRGVRRIVAARMTAAWTQIPHVTTFLTIDATELEAWRVELARAHRDERISILPIVVRALVSVCVAYPKLNASFDDDAHEIVLKREYHVGIATETDRGLVVPIVHGVDRKGIVELAREIGSVVAAARAGTATHEQLTGSTITVSNMGTFGAEFGTPIINPPESAIVALGVIEPRALVVRGVVEPRAAATLSLSFDHRVMDGSEAGRALAELREHLEDPQILRSMRV